MIYLLFDGQPTKQTEGAAIHYIFLSGAHLELCSYVFEEAGLGGKRKESYPLKKTKQSE